MDNKKRKTIESIKDILIVLLACSAVWLTMQSRLVTKMPEEAQPMHQSQPAGQEPARSELIHPLRIAANRVGSARTGRYAVQYDETTDPDLFRQSAGLLVEALSSLGEPQAMTRGQWEQTLGQLPGLYFDFRGHIPMEVLTDWLTGEPVERDAEVRKLVLALESEKSVVLCYRDEKTGQYYRCETQAVNPDRLMEFLSTLTDNGAFFAFESDWCGKMEPDTLLQAELPAPKIYTAENPMADRQSALEALMAQLGFSVSGSNFYTSGDELVARNGTDMLRLSDSGTVRYESDSEEQSSFQNRAAEEESQSLLVPLETCRQIVSDTLGSRSGAAGLYLIRAEQMDPETVEATFGYSLDGIPVWLNDGWAARFRIKNGTIVRFDLNFRTYTDSGEVSHILPPRQAAAALSAMDLEGEELILLYGDSGGDTVTAGWASADLPEKE